MQKKESFQKRGARRWFTRQELALKYKDAQGSANYNVADEIIKEKKKDPTSAEQCVRKHPDAPDVESLTQYLCFDEEVESEQEDVVLTSLFQGVDAAGRKRNDKTKKNKKRKKDSSSDSSPSSEEESDSSSDDDKSSGESSSESNRKSKKSKKGKKGKSKKSKKAKTGKGKKQTKEAKAKQDEKDRKRDVEKKEQETRAAAKKAGIHVREKLLQGRIFLCRIKCFRY